MVDLFGYDQPQPVATRLDAEFATWWQAYPRRVAKLDAIKAYTKARSIADAATILAGAVRYAAAMAGKDPRYIAHPASWLNSGRWMDEPEAPRQSGHDAVDEWLRQEISDGYERNAGRQGGVYLERPESRMAGSLPRPQPRQTRH